MAWNHPPYLRGSRAAHAATEAWLASAKFSLWSLEELETSLRCQVQGLEQKLTGSEETLQTKLDRTVRAVLLLQEVREDNACICVEVSSFQKAWVRFEDDIQYENDGARACISVAQGSLKTSIHCAVYGAFERHRATSVWFHLQLEADVRSYVLSIQSCVMSIAKEGQKTWKCDVTDLLRYFHGLRAGFKPCYELIASDRVLWYNCRCKFWGGWSSEHIVGTLRPEGES